LLPAVDSTHVDDVRAVVTEWIEAEEARWYEKHAPYSLTERNDSTARFSTPYELSDKAKALGASIDTDLWAKVSLTALAVYRAVGTNNDATRALEFFISTWKEENEKEGRIASPAGAAELLCVALNTANELLNQAGNASFAGMLLLGSVLEGADLLLSSSPGQDEVLISYEKHRREALGGILDWFRSEHRDLSESFRDALRKNASEMKFGRKAESSSRSSSATGEGPAGTARKQRSGTSKGCLIASIVAIVLLGVFCGGSMLLMVLF